VSEDQRPGEHVYLVTAENDAGQNTAKVTLYVVGPPGEFLYPKIDHPLVPGDKVKVKPTLTGAHPKVFSIRPALPKGLMLDDATGEIKGVFLKGQKTLPGLNGENGAFVVTGENGAGLATSRFILPVLAAPGAFTYPEHGPYSAGGEV